MNTVIVDTYRSQFVTFLKQMHQSPRYRDQLRKDIDNERVSQK